MEYREKVKRWKSFNKKLDINNLEYITADLLEFYDPVTRQFEPPKHRYNGRKPVVGPLCDDIQSTPLIGSKKFKNHIVSFDAMTRVSKDGIQTTHPSNITLRCYQLSKWISHYVS